MSDSHQIKAAFLERLQLAKTQSKSLEFIPEWIENNTTHPTKAGKNFSYEGHEFQKGIIKSTAHKQTIIKVSQAGLTEVSVRKGLALASLRQGIQLIYTLPTKSLAGVIAKTRVDPVIEGSEILSQQINADTNNTEIKRIGASFLHFAGTFSDSAPISIPATYIISDEVDFSDQSVLSDFNSRLGHQDEESSGNIKFSTPTAEGYGISEEYSKSSKGVYAVKCNHCSQWQTPNFLDDVVVPNLTFDVREITSYNLEGIPRKDILSSYLSCPSCTKDMTEALINPERRAWVHQHPEKQKYHEGFKVAPFDVPTINPVHRTLQQIGNYKRISSWYNFKLGEPYSDDTSMFNVEVIKAHTKRQIKEGVSSCCIGVDVGKISWISIGVPTKSTTSQAITHLDVVALVRVDTNTLPSGSTLGTEILKYGEQYNARVIIVDAAPDFTTAQFLHKTYHKGKALGNYYTGEKTFSKKLSYWKENQAEGTCISARTSSLDDLCSMSNNGRITFPQCEQISELVKHFSAVKRIDVSSDSDTAEGKWVTESKKADHWVHSLNYLHLACQVSDGEMKMSNYIITPTLSSVTRKRH